MQQAEQIAQATEPRQVSNVVGVSSTLNGGSEVTAVVHDACNMISALDLYCDLIQEPGVLATPYVHYSGELRLVAAASRRLVDKLVSLQPAEMKPHADVNQETIDTSSWPVRAQQSKGQRWKDIPEELITNLAEEVLANRSLLSSLAGPTIALTVDAEGGAMAVSMTSEDLTRILINLVKNSTEAMSALGRIHISIWEGYGEGNTRQVILNVEDNGPGLPDAVLEKLFQPQSALSPARDKSARGEWPRMPRGLGLSITRSIVDAAGGAIHAANRDPVGACVQIELPVRAS